MTLTKAERWILINQLTILSHLKPEDAEDYKPVIEALQSGYELHYDEFTEFIYSGNDTMTEDECGEVIDILSMFEALQWAYDEFGDNIEVEKWRTDFRGFDGNTESKYAAYARYVIKTLNRFESLDDGSKDFNSHLPVLQRYRNMLHEWNSLPSSGRYDLTKEQLIHIANQDY